MQQNCHKPQPQDKYTWVYEQSNANSLIMLAPPQEIIESVFREIECKWIWLDIKPNDQKIGELEEKLGIVVEKFGKVDEAEEFRRKERGKGGSQDGEYVVICHRDLQESAKLFKKNFEDKFILFSSDIWDQEPKQPISPSLKSQVISEQNFHYTTSKAQLYTLIQQYNLKKLKTKQLPNFTSVSSQTWSSNQKIKIMFSMLNDGFSQKIRKYLVEEMRGFFDKVFERKVVSFEKFGDRTEPFFVELSQNSLVVETASEKSFMEELSESVIMDSSERNQNAEEHQQQSQITQLSEKSYSKISSQSIQKIRRVFHWYTVQSPIYHLLNSILRFSQHPAEAFYIQPYFKDLFRTIKILYQNFLKKKEKKKIICYRGGMISKNQIEALERQIGGIVENLGFLSSSLNMQTAQEFIKNVFYEIEIDCQQLNVNSQEFGFAEIEKYSHYYSEGEILFNPMCSFKVVSVKTISYKEKQQKIVQKYEIKLLYGEFNKIMNKKLENCTEKEIALREMRKTRENTKIGMECQGDVLLKDFQAMQGGQQYWRKYCQLAATPEQKIKGHQKLAICRRFVQDYHGSQQQLKKALKFLQQTLNNLAENPKTPQNELTNPLLLKYFTISNNLGLLSTKQKDYQTAISHFQKCLQPFTPPYTTVQLIQVRKNMAQAYFYNGEPITALKLLKSCEANLLKKQNTMHPLYGSILNDMATINFSNGNYQCSLDLYLKSQKIKLINFGQKDLEYTRVLMNTGYLYSKMGLYGKALEIFERCKKLRKMILGERHVEYLRVGFEIGRVWREMGRVEEALEMQERCLEMRIEVLGEKCEMVLMSLFEIGKLYQILGQYQQALHFYQKSLSLSEQLHLSNDNHSPNTITQQYHTMLLNQGLSLSTLEDLRYIYYEMWVKIGRVMKGKYEMKEKVFWDNWRGMEKCRREVRRELKGGKRRVGYIDFARKL